MKYLLIDIAMALAITDLMLWSARGNRVTP